MRQNVVAVMMMCGVLLLKGAMGQENGQEERGYVERGRELYVRHCAACHGVDGRGSGPAAAALRKKPADLTVIQKAGEEFPLYRVMTFIDGERVVPAHGTREMPIWGKVFRRAEGEALKQLEIYALAKYLEAIQKNRGR
jgi:mono/diheme cytochrome c family protein